MVWEGNCITSLLPSEVIWHKKITEKDVTHIMKIKQVLLEIGKGWKGNRCCQSMCNTSDMLCTMAMV